MTSHTSDVSRKRCRLCLAFAAGYLHSVQQVAPLCPTATSVHLPRSVDCYFATPQEASAALQHLVQTGAVGVDRQLHSALLLSAPAAPHHATGQSSSSARSPSAVSSVQRRTFKDLCRLYVRGLQRTVCVQQLRDIFSGCCDVTIPANNWRGNNGYAFVQFERADAAAVHLRKPPTLDGRRLLVSYALERDAAVAAAANRAAADGGGDGVARFVPVDVDLAEVRHERIEAGRQRQKSIVNKSGCGQNKKGVVNRKSRRDQGEKGVVKIDKECNQGEMSVINERNMRINDRGKTLVVDGSESSKVVSNEVDGMKRKRDISPCQSDDVSDYVGKSVNT